MTTVRDKSIATICERYRFIKKLYINGKYYSKWNTLVYKVFKLITGYYISKLK